jgi:hypothetical protein
MRIAVAILTWNRAVELSMALESVKAQTRPADEIVVVDSASTDDTCQLVRQRYPEAKLVRLHRNMGCPVGRNIALANCTTEIIYSLDDDGRLHPHCLEVIEQVFVEKPKAGIVASKIMTDLHPSIECVAAQLTKAPRRTARFSGGASAITRDVLQKVGYYPAEFWRQAEETDLALRTLDAGFKIWYAPGGIVFHPLGVGSTPSALYDSTLNTLRSVVRLCPTRYLLPILAHQLAKYVVLGARQGKLISVGAGIGLGLLSWPALLRQRRPVRPKTMREFLRLRREYFEYLKMQR